MSSPLHNQQLPTHWNNSNNHKLSARNDSDLLGTADTFTDARTDIAFSRKRKIWKYTFETHWQTWHWPDLRHGTGTKEKEIHPEDFDRITKQVPWYVETKLFLALPSSSLAPALGIQDEVGLSLEIATCRDLLLLWPTLNVIFLL